VARYYIGEVGVELMESLTDEGQVARFIKNQGEGIMLLSLAVNNVKEACQELEDQSYPLVGPPRPFRNGEFSFIHPNKMNGVLLELIDEGQTKNLLD
ncbi:MAG: VOC family protein, partial [Motiliproteus sp.]